MRTVLVVMPQFAPSSYPPAQRVRLFANHLPEFGWNPVVLTVEPEFLEEPPDWEFASLVEPHVEVVRTRALQARWTRRIGIGDLGIRTLPYALAEAGRICGSRKVDALFIPGPPWHTFLVGPSVRRRFGIPYVIDYIDPWVMSLGEDDPPWTKAYWFRRMALALEPRVIRDVAHVTAVSKGTIDGVRRRHPELLESMGTEIPYGGEPKDFEILGRSTAPCRFFDPADGLCHLVYVGAMLPRGYETLRALFSALGRLRAASPEVGSRIRLHFVGTTYQVTPVKRGLVAPVAEEMGLADAVTEYPARVPYGEAVRTMCQATGLLALGTTETHYTASKIFPTILARRPFLAVFHEESSVAAIVRRCRVGELVTYGSSPGVSARVDEIALALERLARGGAGPVATDWAEFEAYTVRTMTGRLARVLDGVAATGRSRGKGRTG